MPGSEGNHGQPLIWTKVTTPQQIRISSNICSVSSHNTTIQYQDNKAELIIYRQSKKLNNHIIPNYTYASILYTVHMMSVEEVSVSQQIQLQDACLVQRHSVLLAQAPQPHFPADIQTRATILYYMV